MGDCDRPENPIGCFGFLERPTFAAMRKTEKPGVSPGFPEGRTSSSDQEPNLNTPEIEITLKSPSETSMASYSARSWKVLPMLNIAPTP